MTTSAALSLGYVAIYVALGGVASFIESQPGADLGPSSSTRSSGPAAWPPLAPDCPTAVLP
jgi:hypothetical protein